MVGGEAALEGEDLLAVKMGKAGAQVVQGAVEVLREESVVQGRSKASTLCALSNYLISTPSARLWISHRPGRLCRNISHC